ncbi:IclR family transcriptional regulator [Granulosicoccus antarcticus]|nr:IclR family transcriptional regulator [Granulosicoccus antarcticus]
MKDKIKNSEKNGIQVIARSAAILRTLRDHPNGVSIGQIAVHVDLPRSTVQRIVGALQNERLIISDGQRGHLFIGPEVKAMADASRSDIVRECQPLLAELTAMTGETTDLSVMRLQGMVFLDQVIGKHRLRAVSAVGEIFPFTTTANGRACLAKLTDTLVRKRVTAEWKQQDFAGDMEEFLTQLQEVRRSGLAYDMGEHTLGLSAIGCAFKDRLGTLHAISVPIPTPRFDEARESVEAALSETVKRLELMMTDGLTGT